jgi:hypothetical protein
MVNPLESVANLADVMLVLAVALMLAIITHWNVDMSAVSQIDESNLTPAGSDVTSSDIVDSTSGKEYKEVGKVYMDVATGEMYMLKDTEGSDDGAQ